MGRVEIGALPALCAMSGTELVAEGRERGSNARVETLPVVL